MRYVYADTSCGKGNCMDKADELPCIMKGKEREEIMRLMKEDRSLDRRRKMADNKEGDLVWEKCLLIKKKTDHVGREIRLIVLPKSCRERLLALAHDRTGHLGSIRTRQILTRQFIWPGCGTDVAKANKTGSRKAPMVARLL